LVERRGIASVVPLDGARPTTDRPLHNGERVGVRGASLGLRQEVPRISVATPLFHAIRAAAGTEWRRLNRHALHAVDQPLGRLGVHMIVRNTQRPDDARVLAILGTASREHDLVMRAAAGRERMVDASVCRAARLPLILTNLTRLVAEFA
jgi:hypothetical protein